MKAKTDSGQNMQLTQDNVNDQHIINSYSPGAIGVDGETHNKSIIITPQQLITHWRPQSLDEITETDWEPILNLKPDIFLLGTGLQFKLPKHSLLARLYENNIGVESMDTAAACRTYMALLSEDRNVLAALLIK